MSLPLVINPGDVLLQRLLDGKFDSLKSFHLGVHTSSPESSRARACRSQSLSESLHRPESRSIAAAPIPSVMGSRISFGGTDGRSPNLWGWGLLPSDMRVGAQSPERGQPMLVHRGDPSTNLEIASRRQDQNDRRVTRSHRQSFRTSVRQPRWSRTVGADSGAYRTTSRSGLRPRRVRLGIASSCAIISRCAPNSLEAR